jgi:branched-chain amino acid transport system permease protein
MMIWGRSYFSFPPFLKVTTYEFAGASITDMQIGIVALASLLMAGLLWVVHRTRLGLAMRATSQNLSVAALMGVDANRIIVAAFLIGAALAAVAGVMVSAYYGIAHYYMGFMLGLKAFTAAVLGGIGSMPGAVVGGLVIGVVRALSDGYLEARWTNSVVFGILILTLVFRPSGLLGAKLRDKV